MSRNFDISFGILIASELPDFVIVVFLPSPQIPFSFADSSIFFVVFSSVKDSPHLLQIWASNFPKSMPNRTSFIFPFFKLPFSHIGHFIFHHLGFTVIINKPESAFLYTTLKYV